MKTIKLNYDEYAISDEAYMQIKAIADANRVCGKCERAYTPENPNVAENMCLACFQERNGYKRLTYVQARETNTAGDTTHWFIDPEHIIHSTSTGSKEPTQSIYDTLLHWGFPVPETCEEDGETKPPPHSLWHIYGNPKTDLVMVIANSLAYGSTRRVEFLSYREGAARQINRRKGEDRRLFQKAKAQLEATVI